MRLLAIGFPLPSPDVDNYTVLTAPSYFDYDALLVDPESLTSIAARLQDEGAEFEAQDGRPIINGPSSAASVGAADQFLRRTEETQRLLDNGGVVIVLGRPNATQAGIRGFEGCDRYSWLPAPAGVAWGQPNIRAAEGRQVRIEDDTHPIASVLREFRNDFRYRAVFDDRSPAFVRTAHVIATGGAGLPIAAEFRIGSGRVVFIPALPSDSYLSRSTLADGLVNAAKQMLSSSDQAEPPYWARTVAVPGLEQVEAELEEAEAAVREARERIEPIRERHDTLASYRRLLTTDGPAFTAAVRDALVLLGFEVTSSAGAPLQVESEGRHAFVETEGSREQVVEWPYIRLQRRLEQRMLKQGGELPKGIVVANGHRETAPEQRTWQVSEPLTLACENYRYALLTGETLFALVRRALGGAEEGTLLGMRRTLFAAAGLVTEAAALGETVEGEESGPIF